MRRRRAGALLCAAALLGGLDLTVVFDRVGDPDRNDIDLPTINAAMRQLPATPEAPPTTAPPAPPPTEPPSTTTVPPPPPPPPPPPARPGAWTLGPYQGTGVWLDVYDWTLEITNGRPRFTLDDIDRMADLGIQTLFIQTGHRRSPNDVIEWTRLIPIIEKAHHRGMAVVAWYLPTLVDVQTDLRRLVAATTLPFDGIGVDIEATDIADPAERTRRLLELSTALRQHLGDRPMSAITLDAVHLQVVNPSFWPGFPWAEVSQLYDVIVPMSYWSVRKPEWRSGERYTRENIDRIRAVTRPDMPIHIAGGIADGISPIDVNGMVHAIQTRGALGGSLYDWFTSQAPQWDVLRALRVG